MGVRGLTTLLQNHGMIPKQNDGDDDHTNASPYAQNVEIQPNSSLAVDGSSLAFHIVRMAYFHHYACITSDERQDEFVDYAHLMFNLLPSLTPLSIIESKTKEILLQFVQKYRLNVRIYLDGNGTMFKVHTDESRADEKCRQDDNLHLFITKNILPKSFQNGSKLPKAELFLKEFPLPVLWFDQVMHSFNLMEHNIRCGQLDVETSFHIVNCPDEADRYVALASAIDVTNTTYAIGTDSDYIIYGFPMEHMLVGDLNVQYVPLNTLEMGEAVIKGTLLTRSNVAKTLRLSIDSLLEVSILMGNDYTKHFVQSRDLKRDTNYFRDFCESGEFSTFEDIIDCFIDRSDNYKVTSNNEDFQLAINFTRDLFSFKELSHYPNFVKGDGEGLNRFLAIDMEFYYSMTLLEVEKMMEDDYSRDTLNHQILTAFSEIDSKDEPDAFLLRIFQNSLELGDNSQNFLIPHPDWKSYLLSYQMEMSIKMVLKARRLKGISPECSPSKLFHFGYIKNVLDVQTLEHDLKDNETESWSSVESESVNLNSRQVLPIDEFKDEILSRVRENQITVIQGETGCGKSSRVPVMLLEAPPPDPNFEEVKIFICQPRRIAAKSLTERVRSTEEHLKDLIALRMGMGVREYESTKTRAYFCTTGYLVRLLAKYPDSFKNCTHVIIDEVHERSIDTDVLCLLSRRLLVSFPHIRLILMSATVAAELYCDYFNISQKPIFVGRRCHAIKDFFIEDIAKEFQLGGREKKIAKDIENKCLESKCTSTPNAHYMNDLNHLITQIALNVGDNKSSVLIFVPGMADIVSIIENFDAVVAVGKRYICIPIHSDIPFDEQLLAFEPPKNGEVKIIIATNAAESSVTLPDVDHVICTGLCKQIVYNEKSHRQMLTASWISKASATQRAGRTGRVRPGNVYRLYPKKAFDSFLAPFECGEILRSPLDTVILNLRTIVSEESVIDLLLDCLEAPKVENIQRSLVCLYTSGFIDQPFDEFEITALGNLVVNLGIDSTLGKLIGLGLKLGVLEAAIEIANALSSSQSVWLIPNSIIQDPIVYNDITTKTQMSMARFDASLYSDPMATVNLLYDFERCKNKIAFCKKFSVSYPRIQRLLLQRNNLRHRVATVLKKKVEDLYLLNPLSKMSHSTITLLRLINVWLFYENLIEFKFKPKLVDNSLRIKLSGDSTVEEHHIHQFLDKNRHPFTLKNDKNIVSAGNFITNLDEDHAFEFDDFEERMLSAAIVKDFNLIIYCYQCDCLSLYVLNQKKHMLDILCEGAFSLEQIFLFMKSKKRRRGWKSRNCGEFDFERKDVDSYRGQGVPDQNAMLRYGFSQKISNKILKNFKKTLKTLTNTFNILFLRVGDQRDGGESSLDLQSYGSSDQLSDQDLKDMLGTPNVSLYTKEMNQTQSITLNPTPQHSVYNSESSSQEPLLEHVNEAFGILSAVSSLQRHKPEIYFMDDRKDIIKISFETSKLNDRWRQFPSGNSIFISTNNFPSTIFPTEDAKVYACCANSLLIRGGMIRVEGITILPTNDSFLPLAMRCIDKNYTGTEDLTSELRNLADSFFESFHECNNLAYQPEAVQLLEEIFKLNGYGTTTGNLSDADEMILKDDSSDKTNDSEDLTELANRIESQLNFIENSIPSSNLMYQCPACEARFSVWKSFKQHMFDSHEISRLSKKDTKSYQCGQNEQHKKPRPKYQCPICQKTPLKWKALNKHVQEIHGGEEKLDRKKCLVITEKDDGPSNGVDFNKYIGSETI